MWYYILMWPRWHRTHISKETLDLEPTQQPSTDVSIGLGVSAMIGVAYPEIDQEGAEVRQFDQLRTNTLRLMRSVYDHRIATDPTPTPQEISLGMYVENLEPQVRDATLSMREKGYQTSASGFFNGDITWRIIGIDGEDVPLGTYASTIDTINKRAQTMDFSQGFELSQIVITSLAELDAEAIRHPADGLIHRIGFVPNTPDLDAITTQWGAIAAVLPIIGNPTPPAEAFNASFTDWGSTAP